MDILYIDINVQFLLHEMFKFKLCMIDIPKMDNYIIQKN